MTNPAPLLLGFYGDDFTGSTDALESLAVAGVKTVLFTRPPTADDLAAHPGLQAFGIAGRTRAMTPADAEGTLRLAFESFRDADVGLVHYKVCSTFDSSPTVGSIGRVMEVGLDTFGESIVPILVGAPSLGRHCVFGNLFARYGAKRERYRLDRHPSVSRHPITPMTEADLRKHLSLQTSLPVGLIDVVSLGLPCEQLMETYEQTCALMERGGVLIDLVDNSQLPAVGRLLLAGERRFVVGSSGVESALCAAWTERGILKAPAAMTPPGDVGPIIVVCGSCSPVTGEQIRHAVGEGFAEVILSPNALDVGEINNALMNSVGAVSHALGNGRSVVLHTDADHRVAHTPAEDARLGTTIGHILRRALQRRPVKRVVIAGGDTSGRVANTLGISALEMIAPLTRGAPLCVATAPNAKVNGLQLVFKGGQIGPPDFFSRVRNGLADSQ